MHLLYLTQFLVSSRVHDEQNRGEGGGQKHHSVFLMFVMEIHIFVDLNGNKVNQNRHK